MEDFFDGISGWGNHKNFESVSRLIEVQATTTLFQIEQIKRWYAVHSLWHIQHANAVAVYCVERGVLNQCPYSASRRTVDLSAHCSSASARCRWTLPWELFHESSSDVRCFRWEEFKVQIIAAMIISGTTNVGCLSLCRSPKFEARKASSDVCFMWKKRPEYIMAQWYSKGHGICAKRWKFAI